MRDGWPGPAALTFRVPNPRFVRVGLLPSSLTFPVPSVGAQCQLCKGGVVAVVSLAFQNCPDSLPRIAEYLLTSAARIRTMHVCLYSFLRVRKSCSLTIG